MPKTASVNSAPAGAARAAVWRSSRVSKPAGKKRPACSGRPTLLWIDDFEPGLALYRAMFENLGFNVLTASSGEAGLKLAMLNRVDVVVTDYEMPEMNGEAVAVALKSVNPQVPVVLFSGSTLVPSRTRRVIDAYCDKAGSRDQLLATIHQMLHKKGVRSLQPAPLAWASDERQGTVA
jgi:CheY-like chemotaxis protein